MRMAFTECAGVVVINFFEDVGVARKVLDVFGVYFGH